MCAKFLVNTHFIKTYIIYVYECLVIISTRLTFHILHDHAEVPPCLKRAEHRNHKGIFSKGEDVSLHKHLLNLVPKHQVLPVDLLHGKTLTGFLVANQKYSPTWQEEGGERAKEKEGKLQDKWGQRVYEGLSGVGKEGGEKDVETYTSLTSEHQFRLEMELSRKILSVKKEILQQKILILVSLPLLLGYLRHRQRD